MAVPATRRAALGAIMAAPLASVPAAAMSVTSAASLDLLRLVGEYEAQHALLDAENEKLPAPKDSEVWVEHAKLRAVCGRLRTRIAFHPVASLADVMLKVRACTVRDLAGEWDDLRLDIERNDGHAYDDDVRRAVTLDLTRFVGAAAQQVDR